RQKKKGAREGQVLPARRKKLVSDHGIKLREEWSANRAAMLEAGMAPRINVATATELALAAAAAGPKHPEAIAIEETRRDRGRPHGKRFGTLVQLTMLREPLDAA